MDSHSRQTQTASEVADERQIDERAVLDQSAREARAGRHAAALALLDRLAKLGVAPSAETLDLRARINAQLGFHLEAERCWVLAARADPHNPRYPLALERLRQTRRPSFRRRSLGLVLIATAALALLIGQGLQQASALREIENQLASDRATNQGQWAEAHQRHADLTTTTDRGLTDLEAMLVGLADRLDRDLPALQGSLSASLDSLVEEQMDRINGLGEALAGRTDALDAAVSDLGVRFDQAISEIAREESMTKRLDGLNDRQTQIKDELMSRIAELAQGARAGLDEERAAREQIQEGLTEIAEGLDQLRAQTEDRLTNLATRVASLRTTGDPESADQPAPPAIRMDESRPSDPAATESTAH